MSKYRKKPVVIDAVQYHAQEYADDPLTFEELPTWLAEACDDGTIKPEFRTEDYWYLLIQTLEGAMLVSPGDWIIRGVKGELYPCRDDIFQATYEPVGVEPGVTTTSATTHTTVRCGCGGVDGSHDVSCPYAGMGNTASLLHGH